ncbi:MerR family transcriptional regulator [Marinobacterium arenosum]|uniref:MerR family transcriptional regulator n=1 Tax=Marinobacterium arenosum TaxID=2862496 RepID=UPI001C9630CB|nr:MerR family transcriptional regulator [Marinobacterium arenosum]MBY4678385.1 MerR family transcriptional regulator [Marinobacterium arenosum]
MYIGEVASRTGLTVKAIRFYEAKGLIEVPARSGRYRIYRERDIEILLLIKEAKLLGATLSELADVIQYRDGNVDWSRILRFLGEIRQRLLERRLEIDVQLARLERCCAEIDRCPDSS